MDAEAYMAMIKKNEEMCQKEISECLHKYSCEPHWQENWVDGVLMNRGLFFKFSTNLVGQQK